MAVGHVHRNVPTTTTNEDPPPLYPSAARAKDCPSDSERGGLCFDARQHNADCRLGNQHRKMLRVARVVTSSIRQTQGSSNVDRAAPAIYDDLHNCVGWPPSDSSSSTVFDSSTCNTMRSMCHERNVHSFPSEARVLSKPSLKTVDSLFFTGEMKLSKRFDPTIMRSSRTTNSREQAAPKHARKSVSFAEQRSQAQRKRTGTFVGSFDGPVIDIASVACGLSSTLFFS